MDDVEVSPLRLDFNITIQKKEKMMRAKVCSIGLLTLLAYSVQSAVTIPTSKGDNGRSALTPSETTLTLQNINSNTFGLLFERPVSGDMYPQPLIVSGLSIAGGTHNVV